MAKLARWGLALLLVVGLMGGTGMPAYADTLDDVLEKGVLTVGIGLVAPPFGFRDEQGNPTGFAVDLVTMAAEEMGVRLEIVDMAWAGLIPALTTGRVDMLGTHMSTTLERALRISFTDPWLYTGTVAVVRDDTPIEDFTEANDPKYRVGAIAGAIGEVLVREKFPEAELRTYRVDADQFQALKSGRIDVALNDEMIAVTEVLNDPSLRILPGMVQPDSYAFAVRPEDVHLWQWLNLFFEKIKTDGRYAALYEQWIGKPWDPTPVPYF